MAVRRFAAFLLLLLHLVTGPASASTREVYIVFLAPPAAAEGWSRVEHRQWHDEFLADTSGSLTCSYSAVFHGFAARLTEAELAAVAKKPGFVRAVPDSKAQTQTTRTPTFMGLTMDAGSLWNDTNYGAGVVIGIVDSGIDGQHVSFRDDGVPEPPATWAGTCKNTTLEAQCNRKLIGAKSFAGDPRDPRDATGHGTHVAGIAAGNFVRGASLHSGLASGTAAGIAPLAHLAVYKACTRQGCLASNISCAIEEAVHDGVHVINLSVALLKHVDFDLDPIAVAAFGAVAKGVVAVAAAGNHGPSAVSVLNDAPWMITVGAGTVDRGFDVGVQLNSSTLLRGESIEQRTEFGNTYSVVDEGDCSRIEPRDISEKLVVCRPRGPVKASAINKLVEYYGAAGIVFIEDEVQGEKVMIGTFDNDNVVQLSSSQGRALLEYIARTPRPSVQIGFRGAVLGVVNSPAVAYFSGRGPSLKTSGVLKPDVLAPGLNIIAARSAPPTESSGFSVMSGTSMAAPHIAGLVALLKNAHRDWSPAEIRSAIMTTAILTDNGDGPIRDELGREALYFDVGAGHVNASFASDPGLVYDIDVDDYGSYICGLLGEDGFRTITRRSNCTEVGGSSSQLDLNYPTIMVPLSLEPVTVIRTVTYVAQGARTFNVTATSDGDRLGITVDPDTLEFSKPGEKRAFTVTVTGVPREETGPGYFIQGLLTWASDSHRVRSPIIALKGLRPN